MDSPLQTNRPRQKRAISKMAFPNALSRTGRMAFCVRPHLSPVMNYPHQSTWWKHNLGLAACGKSLGLSSDLYFTPRAVSHFMILYIRALLCTYTPFWTGACSGVPLFHCLIVCVETQWATTAIYRTPPTFWAFRKKSTKLRNLRRAPRKSDSFWCEAMLKFIVASRAVLNEAKWWCFLLRHEQSDSGEFVVAAPP